MSTFNYTMDLPSDDPSENKKTYHKLPRKILLPPYLETNPYFTQLCDASDEVFDLPIETKIHAMHSIRDAWATNKYTEERIAQGLMLDMAHWGGVDHPTNVQQVNDLGLNIATAEALDDVSYRALAKYIGIYWFGKGKNSAIDFLNFVLGTNLTITPLWTQDYVSFSPYPGDGAQFIFSPGRRPITDYYPVRGHSVVGGWTVTGYASGVGSPLQQYFASPVPHDPPAWYPTTHIDIQSPDDTAVGQDVIGRLFYEIANYNLVIRGIKNETTVIPITDDPNNPGAGANIIGLGHIMDHLVFAETNSYPILYHSTVGGQTGGVGTTLMQLDKRNFG